METDPVSTTTTPRPILASELLNARITGFEPEPSGKSETLETKGGVKPRVVWWISPVHEKLAFAVVSHGDKFLALPWALMRTSGQGGQTDGQRGRVGFVEMLEEVAAVGPEVPVGTVKTQQLGQLRARQEEGDTALEADHHAFRDEIDDGPGLDQPGDERNARYQQRCRRRQRAEPSRVTAGDFTQ